MPLVTKTFSDIITFTRNSGATYFDSNGVLQTAGNNVPRLDYNPITLAAQGLLIEEQRTNLLLQSADFTQVVWSKIRSSITADNAVSPDGAMNADKLVEDTSNNSHILVQGASVVSGTAYTFSFFLKSAERTSVLASMSVSFPANSDCVFDAATGIATNVAATAVSMISVGNGWYKCSVTATANATGTGNMNLYMRSGGSINYLGNGTSGILVWGAQLEAGAFSTSYIPTTTTALTRYADVASVNTLSPWYNATSGTLYAEWVTAANDATNNRGIAALDDGSNNNRVAMFVPNSFTPLAVAARVVSGGTAANPANAGSIALSSIAKSALTYGVGTNQAALCVNGGTPTTASPAAAPIGVSTLRIGAIFGVTQLGGWVRRITYYPRGLSSAELQAITA